MECIRLNDTIVFESSDGRRFFEQISENRTIRLGKKLYGLGPCIGLLYGTIVEANKGNLVVVSGELFDDLNDDNIEENPATDNRNYNDTNTAQQLTQADIESYQEEGVAGQAIIAELVKNSATFAAKTEFSKQKYLKKKQKKYMPRMRLLKATAQRLSQVYFSKGSSKICHLRGDSLAQVLMYGNVHAGAQVLVIDSCMGLLVGAVAERMGCQGRILAGYDGQQASSEIYRCMNFDKEQQKVVIEYPYYYLEQLNMDEDELATTENVLSQMSDEAMAARKVAMAERASKRTAAQQELYLSKMEMKKVFKERRVGPRVVRDYLRMPSDSLLIASHYDPTKMLLKMLPYLGYSKPFVVFHEHLEPLVETYTALQYRDDVINIELITTWTREYQVLPRRTHPSMKMNSCAGYMLYGIKVKSPNASPNAFKVPRLEK